MLKVVTAQEMVRIEKIAYADGFSESDFMEEAGRQVALFVEQQKPQEVVVVLGKGNNAGDGKVAARYLQQRGFSVTLLPIFEKPLVRFPQEGLIIDAIFGTGFEGKLEGTLLQGVQMMNQSGLPIVSIDIPSGLNGTSGEVGSDAVRATWTVALELPKTGFFLQRGMEFLGRLETRSFGLPQTYIDQAHAEYEWVDQVQLPERKRTWHKYSRGYVIALAGSSAMQGAAHLCTKAALRSGAGIVRLMSGGWTAELPEEVLTGKIEDLESEAARAGALLVGPGLGRSVETKSLLQRVFSIQKPMVIDADALFADLPFPQGAVLTPHRGEMERLLGEKGLSEEQLLRKTAEFARKRQCVVVLKGPATFVFGERRVISTAGHPAMATAGSGDVLTGIIAALLAQGQDPFTAAYTGVEIHGRAGSCAAEQLGYGEIAGDMIAQLPLVIKSLEG